MTFLKRAVFILLCLAAIVLASFAFLYRSELNVRLKGVNHEDFYQMESRSGVFFYELSELLSSRMSGRQQVTILPMDDALSQEPEIVTKEFARPIRSIYAEQSGGPLAPGVHAVSVTRKYSGGSYCLIRMRSIEWGEAHKFLVFDERSLRDANWMAFWHEIGHCYHSLEGMQQSVLPDRERVESEFMSILNTDHEGVARVVARITRNMTDDPWELLQVNLIEGFADAFFYAVSVEHGIDSRMVLQHLRQEVNARHGATHYTLHFVDKMIDQMRGEGGALHTDHLMESSEAVIRGLDLSEYIAEILRQGEIRRGRSAGSLKLN